MRLTDSQRSALILMLDRERHAARPWTGAREGVSGTTIEALAARGLALSRWTDRPYRRIVGRLTQAGIAKARELDLRTEAI